MRAPQPQCNARTYGRFSGVGKPTLSSAQGGAQHPGELLVRRQPLGEQIDGHVGLRSEGNNLPEWDEGQWAAYVDRLTRIAEDHA